MTIGHELWLQWKETEKNMKKRAKYVFFHHFSGGGFLQTVHNKGMVHYAKMIILLRQRLDNLGSIEVLSIIISTYKLQPAPYAENLLEAQSA